MSRMHGVLVMIGAILVRIECLEGLVEATAMEQL